MEEAPHQVIPDQWPSQTPKRSHSQMSAEHRQAQHDGLADWVREVTATPGPTLDQALQDYLTTPAPPSPFTHLTGAFRFPSPSPAHLDSRRSLDLRRPADPSRPPQQQHTPSVTSMPPRANDVEVIDLTDGIEPEDEGEGARQQYEIVDLEDQELDGEDQMLYDELERLFDDEHRNHVTPDDGLFVQPPPAARGPRFGRNIIDLSAEASPPPQHDPTLSPEVQFVRARARSTPPPPAPDPPQVVDITASDDLNDEDDNDIQFVREVRRIPDPLHGLRPPPFLEPNLAPQFIGAHRNHVNMHEVYRDVQWGHWLANRRHVQRNFTNPILRDVLATPAPPLLARFGLARPAAAVASFVAPIMDYAAPAFNLGRPPPTVQQRAAREESPIPTLEPVAKGFYRAPHEDGIDMVCPHCGDELGAGASDAKRQVWVIKACGHTYCGECTIHRFKNKGKGKAAGAIAQRPSGYTIEPFSMCRVDGCESKIGTRNTMIQLFL